MPVDIRRTQESHKYDQDNQVQRTIVVTWWAGPKDGPFTNEFPVDTPGTTIRQTLEQRAQEILRARGQ